MATTDNLPSAPRRRIVPDAPRASPRGACAQCDPDRGDGTGGRGGASLLSALNERAIRGNAKRPSPPAAAAATPATPALSLSAARFASLRLAADLDAAAAPSPSDRDQREPPPPPPYFARRRSKIVEAVSASVRGGDGDDDDDDDEASLFLRRSSPPPKTLLLALTAAGGCAAFCRSTGRLLAHLNASGDDVIRSIFYNRQRSEVVAVSVCRGDSFSSLRCRAVPLSAVASLESGKSSSDASEALAAASRPLFVGEELRWPGFVEFDDVNGVVLTRSCGASRGDEGAPAPPPSASPRNATYSVHDLADYSLRFRVDGAGVREVRTAPGLLLLVMEPRATASSSSERATPTAAPTAAAGGGVPCRLLSISDGTPLASFDAPTPPGGGGRLDFIELFGHTLLVGGGSPPTLTRVDVRGASAVANAAGATAAGRAKVRPEDGASAVAPAVSPPTPFATPSAFIFLHEARLFLAFGSDGGLDGAGATEATEAAGALAVPPAAAPVPPSASALPAPPPPAPRPSLLPSSSVVVCDSAGRRVRSLDGAAVAVGSSRAPGGPAANSVYVTADQQFIVSYSATGAGAAPTGGAPSRPPSCSRSRSSSRCASCGGRGGEAAAPASGSPSSSSASPSPSSPPSPSPSPSASASLEGCRLGREQPPAKDDVEEGELEVEEEELEEEVGGVITVSHVLSGRCVARISAKRKKEKAERKRKRRDSSSADDGDDVGGDESSSSSLYNDAVRRALSDVSALFFDEDTGELITGSADGHLHVWSNRGID